MMSKKLSILVILVILLSFAQAKDECPQKCECSDNFSVVKCRGMETFPVFDFASKVRTLDLTHGKIKTIHEHEVKAYKSLENLFISHNPLDCDHATTHILKHALRESAKLKSFDGHKIKCQHMMPKISKDPHDQAMAASGHVHHGMAWAWPSAHFHGVPGHSVTPGMAAGVVILTISGLIAAGGICCMIIRYKRRSCSSSEEKVSDAEDPMSQMEEGTATTESDRVLMEGLRQQRRSSQGFPENAIVDSEEDYLKEKMKKRRRLSQGYADGAGSSDEESAMVEINLNEELYSSGN